MFEKGKLILVPFPFTDLKSQKLRPAVILSEKAFAKEDVIVAFITSKIRAPKKMHVIVNERDAFFKKTGLKCSSAICCDKIATLDKRIILGEIGVLPISSWKKIEKTLRVAFGL